jgi:hypothetical protein
MHSIASLRHLTDELTAKSKRVLEYSRNRSATGLQRERIVESFVKRIAPQAFGIGSGFIYSPSQSSKQIDILVYDKMNFAPVFDEGGYIVVMPASVVQVIEVKSYLDENSIKAALENIVSATSLNPKIQGSVFGFDGLSWDKARVPISRYATEHIKTNREILRQLPQFIVNLGRWVVHSVYEEGKLCYTYPKSIAFEEQFLYYFSALYYKMYGYQRKLHPEGALPSLESQGFPVNFEPGESDMQWLIPLPKK